jgi:hypothetical protein
MKKKLDTFILIYHGVILAKNKKILLWFFKG